MSFASRAHHGQFRKDEKTPFVAHPSRVAMTLAAVFGCGDETILAAAALHDTIEDTTTDHGDLSEQFGRDVARVQEMLRGFLERRGCPVALLNGGMSLAERRRALEAFRTGAHVLVSTDAAESGSICNSRSVGACSLSSRDLGGLAPLAAAASDWIVYII